MFMGHYAAALATKAAEPRAPLWTYVAGAQLLDIGWSALVAVGVERVSLDESLPGAPLVLDYMPWTHSLPGALAWSAAAALTATYALKLPRRAAWFIGAVVFSHWILDLLVHRPDLAVWFGGPKLGLGLWNAPVIEAVVEMGLLGLAATAWTAHRVRSGQSAWPAIAFLAFLICLQITSSIMPLPSNAVGMGLTMLSTLLLVALVARAVDWKSSIVRTQK